MKRFISIFISVICFFSFSACQNGAGVQPVIPTPTPEPTPIPVVKNEEKFLTDLGKDGQTEEIVISYTSEESLWLGASLELTVKINDTDFIADVSMLPEEYAILHTQYFTVDVDGDETQEIIFSCGHLGNMDNRKVFIFKYADGTITQLPSIMTVDLKFNYVGDKYILYRDGEAWKEFEFVADERVEYGKEYQTNPESYELYLAEIIAEQERLKATFFFYQHKDDFESEYFSVFLNYESGGWKAEE